MYRTLDDALLLRAAACPPGRVRGWPDLITPHATTSWAPWLEEVLTIPGFAAALDQASPDLASRVGAVRAGTAPERDARRVVLAVMRYLLRATTRATPYGLFAGVAPAVVSEAPTVRIGDHHRPVARIRTQWLDSVLATLEGDQEVRKGLLVRANELITGRGDFILLEHRVGATAQAAPVHVRVRATDAVRLALAAAAAPVHWSDLVGKYAAGCDAPAEAAERLLAQLLQQRLLISELRPPMTATDPLAALVAVLDRLPPDRVAADPGRVTSGLLVETLRRVVDLQRRHDRAPSVAAAAKPWNELIVTAAALGEGVPAGVDLRLDAEVSLPASVTAEVCRAAAALTRLSVPAPTGWASWHRRFLERFGPHALVPVRDVVDPVCGLGYPAGFAGADAPQSRPVTARDRALVALAQRAALARQREVVVDEELLRRLGEDVTEPVQATTEMTVRVHAASLADVRDGAFTLSVVRVSRHAGTSTGRMLDLLPAADQRRMATAYATASPLIAEGALLSQLAAPTRYALSMDVARAPQVLPHLTLVGDYHTDDDPRQIPLDDLAVTADPAQLHLVSLSRRRPVQLVPLTAVDPNRQMTPLVRFLAEAATALAAPCHPFDWGPAAHDLPYLPRLRYGRTLLSDARWRLATGDLPGAGADWAAWDRGLAAWRELTGCPPQVSVGTGDQCLVVDLDEPSHRVLLRDYLARYRVAILREAPPGAAWIDDRPHEVVVPLVATGPTAPAPRLPATVTDVRSHGVLPGGSHLYLKVYAGLEEQDQILARHLPDLLSQLPGPWWFQRYHDPDKHLRLRLTGTDTAPVRRWAQHLRAAGLTVRVQIDTDFPEISRFGGPNAYLAAQAVFAADSAAVLAQMTVTGRSTGVHPQALAAASMLDIVTAVLGDPGTAGQWLIERTRPRRDAPPRVLYNQAVDLAGPHSRALAAAAWADEVRAPWSARTVALTDYCRVLRDGGTDPADLLPDLLHLHHTRLAGPDWDAEGVCLHLARAAALSWRSRNRSRA